MKQIKLLFLIATITASLITESANAKIWRVNNSATGIYGENMGGTATFPVYKQLAAANSANIVMAGDTIHLEGSNRIYEAAVITKKLIIIGPGYFLTENTNTSSNSLQAEIEYITFDDISSSTSSGSQLIGVYVGGGPYGTIIKVSNILIKRCRLDSYISLEYNISDISIIQNYFTEGAGIPVIAPSAYGFPSHVIINNNIIKRLLTLPGNPNYTVEECKNNVFAGPAGTPAIQMYVGYFQNNILVNQNATVILNGVSGPSSNPNISYNISSLASTQFGTAYNNIETNMANLFMNLSSTTDAGYQLKPNVPGTGNGSDGTDRGAFGGLSPANHYTLSGLPPIPVIYEIITSGVAGPAGLPVTIKARTIK